MIALTEYWLSRRVQQTAASKVHLPVDPKIVKDGLGSIAGPHERPLTGTQSCGSAAPTPPGGDGPLSVFGLNRSRGRTPARQRWGVGT